MHCILFLKASKNNLLVRNFCTKVSKLKFLLHKQKFPNIAAVQLSM